MAKDRAKDTKRTVGSHEKMMGALGRAAGWKRYSSFDPEKTGITHDIAVHEKGTVSSKGRHSFIPGQGGISEKGAWNDPIGARGDYIKPSQQGERGIVSRKFDN